MSSRCRRTPIGCWENPAGSSLALAFSFSWRFSMLIILASMLIKHHCYRMSYGIWTTVPNMTAGPWMHKPKLEEWITCTLWCAIQPQTSRVVKAVWDMWFSLCLQIHRTTYQNSTSPYTSKRNQNQEFRCLIWPLQDVCTAAIWPEATEGLERSKATAVMLLDHTHIFEALFN